MRLGVLGPLRVLDRRQRRRDRLLVARLPVPDPRLADVDPGADLGGVLAVDVRDPGEPRLVCLERIVVAPRALVDGAGLGGQARAGDRVVGDERLRLRVRGCRLVVGGEPLADVAELLVDARPLGRADVVEMLGGRERPLEQLGRDRRSRSSPRRARRRSPRSATRGRDLRPRRSGARGGPPARRPASPARCSSTSPTRPWIWRRRRNDSPS